MNEAICFFYYNKNDLLKMVLVLINIYFQTKMNEELIEACKAGDINKVLQLVEDGADVHADNDHALRSASLNGHIEVVKILIEKGADVHANNDSSLHSASLNGHIEVVKILIEKGADIHAQNDNALRWASQNGHLEVVKILIEIGADIHAQNEYPLHWASLYGHLEVVKFLIEKGADIHAQNESALHLASRYGHLDIVKFLIEKGANVYVLPFGIKLKLDIPVIWSIKPDNLPPFRDLTECPITNTEFTDSVSKLGCLCCLNIFEKSALEDWLKTGNDTCPMCRTGEDFYLV